MTAHPTIPVPPPKPKHLAQLGRAVVSPPDPAVLERVQQWRHVNRNRLNRDRVLAILDNPRAWA